MTSFFEKNKGLAKGYLNTPDARKNAKVKWVELAVKLNAVGPPMRSVNEWKKVSIIYIINGNFIINLYKQVWADFKTYIKKKSGTKP